MSKKTADTSATTSTEVAVVNPQAPSTALSVREVLAMSKFSAIRPDSDLAEALSANFLEGEDIRLSELLHVKVPSGGGIQWEVPELTGEEYYKEIEGVIVHYSASGALWPSMESKDGTKPIMITQDLKVGELLATSEDDWGDINPEVLDEMDQVTQQYRYRLVDPATGEFLTSPAGNPLYDWQKLPYNAWGTGKNNVGKRCRETRRLCILRAEDRFPLFLRVPPTSINNVGGYIRKLPTAFYNCVSKFSLEKATSKTGQAFSKINCNMAKHPETGKAWILSKAEAAAIKATYVNRLSSAMAEAALDADTYAEQDSGDSDIPF